MKPTAPNIVLIMTDQHCAHHLGCYGNELVRTPNIDALADAGVVYERFYVTTPICMPNRAALMTGRYPSLNGVRHNGTPLSLDAMTFADVLRAAGYHTALVGKAHLQNISEYPAALVSKSPAAPPGCSEATRRRIDQSCYEQESPRRWADPAHRLQLPYYGFDRVDLIVDHGDIADGEYLRWLRRHRPDADLLRGPDNAVEDLRDRVPQAWITRVPEDLCTSSYVARQAQDFLQQRAAAADGRPFFLKCSFPDPHHPFTPPPRYARMYEPAEVALPRTACGPGPEASTRLRWLHGRRALGEAKLDGHLAFAVSPEEARQVIALTYGSITMVDDKVGEIVRALERAGLAENTILIFTSDHGDFMGQHGLMLKAPLHYQSLVRVPFIWADLRPGRRKSLRSRALGSTVDIATTVLRAAGVQGYNGLQGGDLLARAEAPPTGDDAVLIEEDSQRPLFGLGHPPRLRTVVTQRWRLTVYDRQDEGELYDLEADPEETRNLWHDGRSAQVRNTLVERLLRLMIENAERSPLPTRLA